MKKLLTALVLALCTVSLAAQPRLRTDNIDEVLAAHSGDWTAQVEAFNKLFT